MMMVSGPTNFLMSLMACYKHRSLDGHEDQVNRLALLRCDIVEMALFAVADHRLGRVAGNALRVCNDLHAGNLRQEDVQRTQAE